MAVIIVISSDRGKAGIRMRLNMFEPNLPRSILKSSYIISGSVIASSLFVFIPNLLLSVFGEASDIAIFAVCFQLAYTPLIALQPVKMSYMPKVAKSFREKNVNKLVSVILRSAGSFILFGSVPSIIVLLLSNKILLLYGKLLGWCKNTVILALSNALICAMGPVGDFMDMLGKEKLRFSSVIIQYLLFGIITYISTNLLQINLTISIAIGFSLSQLLTKTMNFIYLIRLFEKRRKF